MRVTRANAEQMYTQALAEFPFECCGMIIGPEGEDIGAEDLVRPCRNVQQDLHQKYPERFPRDATIGYTMAKDDIEAIVKEAQGAWVGGQGVLPLTSEHGGVFFARGPTERRRLGPLVPRCSICGAVCLPRGNSRYAGVSLG